MTIHETITAQEKKDNLVNNLLAREQEIYHYQINIDNYTALLASLPSEWPENLLQYRDMSPDQINDNVPLEDMQTVSDLLFQAKISRLLRSEMIEQSKAIHIYNAMASQINAEELPGLLDAGRAALNA